jgi:hypothetical protein
MKKTLIYRAPSCGLGNLLQFAPCANAIEDVCCNDKIYEVLGIGTHWNGEPVETIILPYGSSWRVVRYVKKNIPHKKLIGFKYKIKIYTGLGLNQALEYDYFVSERINYMRHFEHKPLKLSTSGDLTAIWNKSDHRGWPQIDSFRGPEFQIFYEKIILPYKVLIEWVKKCNFFIGTDGGLLHLFALFNVPGIVIWTNDIPRKGFIKNMPAGIVGLSKHSSINQVEEIHYALKKARKHKSI